MSYFKMFEDPMYDEDGVMIDEDSEEGDWQDMEDAEEDIYGPYITVNS